MFIFVFKFFSSISFQQGALFELYKNTVLCAQLPVLSQAASPNSPYSPVSSPSSLQRKFSFSRLSSSRYSYSNYFDHPAIVHKFSHIISTLHCIIGPGWAKYHYKFLKSHHTTNRFFQKQIHLRSNPTPVIAERNPIAHSKENAFKQMSYIKPQ